MSSAGPLIFRHGALLYSGIDGFVRGALPVARRAAASSDPALVVAERRKIDRLRAELGRVGGAVEFADVTDLARNPACIIPAWQDFLDRHREHRGRLWGIGERLSGASSDEEIVECHRHEALTNLAFDGGPPLWLLCPYDVAALPAPVIDEVGRTHPWLHQDGRSWSSPGYAAVDRVHELLVHPLAPPTCDVRQCSFEVGSLRRVRDLVREHAEPVLGPVRTFDLVLAVSEVAANSVLHGGGLGVARVWHDDGGMVCEVSDLGQIDEPLAGSVRPDPVQDRGRGLWIVNQLCDLVQVRSHGAGSTVRLHMSRRRRG